jgi:hypothetical protein
MRGCCWDESEFELSCFLALHSGLFAPAPGEHMGTVFWLVIESKREMKFGCDEIW